MDETDNSAIPKQKCHLNNIAGVTENINPSLSMFYRLKEREIYSFSSSQEEKLKQLKEMSTCIYCGSPLNIGNFSVRLIPRLQPTQRISRLMQKHRQDPSSLGRYQKKLVEDFKTSTNKMKVTCFVCKKSWKLAGQASLDRLKQKREFEDIVKTRQDEEKKVVILDEETLNARREERRERKKELKKQKKQQKANQDWNAGLNIVKLKKDQISNISLAGTSKFSSIEPVSTSIGLNEAIHSDQADDFSKEKQSSNLKLENKDKLKRNDYIQDLQEETKKKQRFAANLKRMLAQEDSTSKRKDASNKKRKTALQAFLTKI